MKTIKGISLIILVITIIVIIILSGSVILSLSENNPIQKANEAVFKSNLKEVVSELDLWTLSKFTDNKGNVDITTIDATKNTGTYIIDDVPQKIDDIIPSIKEEDKDKLIIEDGKIKYIGTDDKEKQWATEVGIVIDTTISSPLPIDVAVGWQNTIILMSDGTLKTFGANYDGQLGIGTTQDKYIPIDVPGLTNIKQISTRGSFTLALLDDGTVKAWGYNYEGQLGDGTVEMRSSPQIIPALSNVKQVAAGEFHSLALLNDGTVKAWGYNDNGLIVNGETEVIVTPTLIQGLTNVKQIDAGYDITLALLEDGTVKAWGANWSGQLGDGTTVDRNIPTEVVGLTNVKQIAARL